MLHKLSSAQATGTLIQMIIRWRDRIWTKREMAIIRQ